MKPDPSEEAGRWLRQAEHDLDVARVVMQNGYYSDTCFMCQQAAEKALKSLAYLGGERFVLGHSVRDLLEGLQQTFPVLRSLKGSERLDQYYVTPRYPNAVPGGAPFELYTRPQAEEAVVLAVGVLDTVRGVLAADR